MSNFIWVEKGSSTGDKNKYKESDSSSSLGASFVGDSKRKIDYIFGFHNSITGESRKAFHSAGPGFVDRKTSGLPVEDEKARLKFKESLKRKILTAFDNDYMDWWSETLAEKIIENALDASPLLAREAVSDLYVENAADEKCLLSLMMSLSHIPYSKVGSQLKIIGVAALSHRSVEVREAAIRMFEMWGANECIEILRSHRVSPDWLMDYMLQVIEDFGG